MWILSLLVLPTFSTTDDLPPGSNQGPPLGVVLKVAGLMADGVHNDVCR